MDGAPLSETLDELMAILSDESAVTLPIRSAREVKSMFATKLKEYGERLKEEAREEGRRKGRQEEKRETASALKEQGVHVEVIAKATGLSTEEIATL